MLQFCILGTIIGLVTLLYFYGVQGWPQFIFKPIYLKLATVVYPSLHEFVTKSVIVVCLYAFYLTRAYKKNPDMNIMHSIITPTFFGGLLFFGVLTFLTTMGVTGQVFSMMYIIATLSGFMLLSKGLANIRKQFAGAKKIDQFDTSSKGFPMETRMLKTEYSINIRCENSVVNIANPFAGVGVYGLPGTGKSFVFVSESIIQSLRQGYTALIYDFKQGELTRLAWNVFNEHYDEILKHNPNIKFNVFDPHSPRHTVRINPLSPKILITPEHTLDAATSFYYSLVPNAADKRGEIFFSESGRIYIICLFLFLRFSTLNSKRNEDGKVEEGNCCTLAHVIALASYMNEVTGTGAEEFYEILKYHKNTSSIFKTAFADAIDNKAGNQLAGQMASGKLPLAFLNSETLFWALTGDETTLDVNNPKRPQVLCFKNAGEVLSELYSPVLGTMTNIALKIMNTEKQKPALVSIDEAYTINLRDIDKVIATGRSNLISVWLIMQDYGMLDAKYKKEQAEIIKSICSTKIAGRVSGSTAEAFEKIFGKSMHDRVSTTITKTDTTTSISQSKELLLPVEMIMDLPPRQFIGIVQDDPEKKDETKKLKYRKFKDTPIVDLEQRKKYKKHQLPEYIVDSSDEDIAALVRENYESVYTDIQKLIRQCYNELQIIK